MKDKPPISIIIPNLNSPIIDKVVFALLRQTFKGRYEIIIIGQDSYNLLNNFKNNRKIKIITTPKPEIPSINRNIGIREALGNYLFFVDADCIPSPNWIIQHMKNYSINNQRVVSGSFLLEKSTNFWQFCDNLSHFHTFSSKRKRGKTKTICSANFSLPRVLLQKVGTFNEKLAIGEDLELSLRMNKIGVDLVFEPAAQIIHLPVRTSFASLLRHSYSWGRKSLKVRLQFSKTRKIPFFMQHHLTLILMTPIISCGVALKIFLSTPALMKYFYTLPIIICSKFAWCLGAISSWKEKDD